MCPFENLALAFLGENQVEIWSNLEKSLNNLQSTFFLMVGGEKRKPWTEKSRS
jgi:hypothetical protein